jgi:hypothetical protein
VPKLGTEARLCSPVSRFDPARTWGPRGRCREAFALDLGTAPFAARVVASVHDLRGHLRSIDAAINGPEI